MGDRHDGHAWFARVGVQQLRGVERFAFEPCLEAGGSQQVVELHGEREAVLRGEEGLEVHHADALQRRVLDLGDQSGNAQVPSLPPGMIEQLRHEDVFPAGDGVGVDAEQRQETGRRCLDTVTVHVRVFEHRRIGRAE